MPRPHLFRTDSFAYHVTTRSNNKEWFYISSKKCWSIFKETLCATAERYGIYIHSLVLMSNHFHLLLSTPQKNLDISMQYFLSRSTQLIQNETTPRRINHIFGARYKWTVLESNHALAYVYKYIYRNPVRIGICDSVEDYSFSTLNDIQGLPIVEGFDSYWSGIPTGSAERLRWLNAPTPKEQEQLIGSALRKYHFKFSTNSNVQQRLRELKSSYLVESTI